MMTDCESSYESSSGMSLNYSSISTPFKPCLRPGNSKPSASEERSHIRDPETDVNFVTTHFSSPTTLSVITSQIKKDISIQRLLRMLEKGSKEWGMYETLAGLFNKVSAIVSGNKPMFFHPSYAKRPLGESRQEDRLLAPDFSILPPNQRFTLMDKHDTLRVPWSTLESFVEVKTKKRSDHRQSIDYIETLLQYRPDKVFALGMFCNEHIYQFYYADACTQKSSPTFSWKGDLGELVQFIHTLRHNHEEDVGRDTSYTLHDVKWSDLNASARWRISFRGKTNEVQRMFARKGTGRRTWLGIGYEINDSSTSTNTSENEKIRIVKDMWRDDSRRFKESEILDQIHNDGYIAGVVRHISAGAVNELTVEARGLKKEVRIKERVDMASTGLRLSACESVLDFLKVMYDLVETHEQLLEQRDVLHRDLSWYNVLCKPEHFTGDAKVIDHPTIGKILHKEGKEREPLCLLTDFDNASIMKEKNHSGAAERTGTPMFMACELSYGLSIRTWLEDVPSITLEQLSLEGNVLEAYLNVYTDERYDKYQEWLQSVLCLPIDNKSTPSTVSHQPHHDMESVYWIIVWFIIKALPTVTEGGLTSVSKESGLHNRLKTNMFSRGLDVGSTTYLLTYSEAKWRDSLDPVYAPLIGMLVTMSRYLCMHWSDLPESLQVPWHAHEAFKRLLLKEIIRMTNDNSPIPIQGPHPPPPKSVSARRSTTKVTTKASPIPLQVASEPSPRGIHTPESQLVGAQKRPNSATPDSEPLSKKPRRMGTAGTVDDNSNSLHKIVENLASDVWWFV